MHGREAYPDHKPSAGIGRVNRMLIETVPAEAPNWDFVVTCRPDYVPPSVENLRRSVSVQRRLRCSDVVAEELECAWFRPDVSYSLSLPVPVRTKALRVGILHDLVPMTMPEYLASESDRYDHAGSWAHGLFNNIRDHADLVQCISEHTQREVIERLGVKEERTFVAYNGCILRGLEVALEKDLGGGGGYVLFVSRIDPRKNLSGLVRAVAVLRERPGFEGFRLLVAGSKGWGFDTVEAVLSDTGGAAWTEFLGHVSDDQLDELYLNASVFVCPSITEGFGMPPLEAMAYGTPVACSTGGALPEVVGEAAEMFDPFSIEEMVEAMVRAVESGRTAERVTKRRDRARMFSPERMAKTVVSAIRTRVG